MSKSYACPKCGQSHSPEERSESIFCRKCGAYLSERAHAKQSLVHPIENETKDKDSFVKQIYSNIVVLKNSPRTKCDDCFQKFEFSTLENFRHKPCFPPVGRPDLGQVLFIGTNPRCRPGTKDEDFYRHAISSQENFLQFSNDGRYKDSMDYWKRLFDDRHYYVHQECLWKVNPSWTLGQKSSVAELFMCGSESTNIFSDAHEYICAEEYLIKYMEMIKPRVIVSFGSPTMRWFQTRFGNDLKRNMHYLDDTLPRDYTGDPRENKIARLHACFSRIRLDSGHTSDVIFSYHPSWMKDKEKLLQTFHFVCTRKPF